jgi:hypothetical protein
MWHLLRKSTLVASHLHNLQTFSSCRVDSIQPYLARVPLVQHKEASIIQKRLDGTTTSWWLTEMQAGKKKGRSLPVVHTMELWPPSCALFRAPLSCRNRKAPSPRFRCLVRCLLHQRRHFLGCASLLLSRSDNLQYQKFRTIGGNVAMKSGSR